tara:strand:+ start:1850 stop:2818 length:969 start_codon:yes stop_codon:yes gene_type:complete
MGKIVHTLDPASLVLGGATYTGVDTSKSSAFSSANIGDFVKQESPGPRKSFFSGVLQAKTASFMYPIALISTSPAKYQAGWHVESATVTDDQWTVVVSEGHSIQTGDTIWFDFGGSSGGSGDFLLGGMQINSGSYYRHVDNGAHDNVTVNGNTLTFTGNYDYGGTFAATYRVNYAQIDSIENPCFYAKITFANVGEKYLTPCKFGDYISGQNTFYAKNPSDTASGALNGWTGFNADAPNGDKVYYIWLVNQNTTGSREGITAAGSDERNVSNLCFTNDTIVSVEIGGALVGNDDYGNFSKDESPIGKSMISNDFITNKIIGN